MSDGKEITIYDIASRLNISAATVSRGLRDNPAISKITRKKILQTAKELGYRSNTFASSLRSKKTHTIGVIVPRLNSHFMSSALAGMEDASRLAGYSLIITQSLESADKEKTNAHVMYNKRVDGLIVSLAYDTIDIRHFDPFFKKKIPLVFFDRIFPHKNSTGVVIDNFKAAYDVTTHLIEQGYKRIMHIGGNLLRDVYEGRFSGYKKALEDNNIEYDEKLLLINSLNEHAGIEAAEEILKMTKKPDAIFVANDTCAVHCMIRLKIAGIKLPEEIAFAGFNNDPISQVIEPNLTTINYSGYLTGETAINNLLYQLDNPKEIKTTDKIVLRSDLIIRESSQKK